MIEAFRYVIYSNTTFYVKNHCASYKFRSGQNKSSLSDAKYSTFNEKRVRFESVITCRVGL